MEDALNMAAQHFSPQIAMALVGGLLGGLIMYDSNKKDYGNRLARLLLVTSIILAGACSDYLLTNHKVISLFIQQAGGMFAGVGGSCLMDAFRVFSPRLFTKLVTNVGNAAVDGVTLVVKKGRDKMSIKQVQNGLAVAVDGVWGNKSQAALDDSHKWLNLSFDKLRSLTPSQVQGFNNTLAVINTFVDAKGKKAAKNPLYLAYMLATKWHETARTMQPIEEYGKGKGRPYGTWLTNSKGEKYCQAVGGRNPYFYTFAEYPHLYYGRGDVQLTWLDNYIKMTKKINAYIDRNPACGLAQVDLANNPAQACDPTIAALVMVIGMLDGDFTGLGLNECIRWGSRADFVKARRIINGTNEDDRIADYAVKFLDCIILSEPQPANKKPS